MGPVGANLAAFLLSVLGLASWGTPPLLAALGWLLIVRREGPRTPYPWLLSGWTAMILAGSAGLSLARPSGEGGSWGSETDPGGILGGVISHVLETWLGSWGAWLAVAVLFLAGLMAATPFSLAGTAGLAAALAGRLRRSMDRTAGAGAEDPVPTSGGEGPVVPRIAELRTPRGSADQEDSSEQQPMLDIAPVQGEFRVPPLNFLEDPPPYARENAGDAYLANARALEHKLLDFGVAGSVVEICPGPVVTMYEFAPAPGVKINKVASLADDLALALKSHSVRIVAPIPGKAVIGIELANLDRRTVYLKEILASESFQKHRGLLPVALGQDIVGEPVVTDLAQMPHLLMAGATGTGKSVGLNAMICSLLYRHTPATLRLLMIDPKRIELSLYDGIPHLLHPVLSEPKEATRALRWSVMEMGRRYRVLEEAQARNLEGYNRAAGEPLPYLVIIIDELADLMMVSSKEVESAITRLAQMARAAGIHLLVATQRPSVDVLTGLIKANFPARISYKVSSKVDSRTILDVMGAERLLGMGDLLFLPPRTAIMERIHGAYVSEKEIGRIVEFLRAQGEPQYDRTVVEAVPGEEGAEDEGDLDGDGADEKYDEAVEIVTQTGQASISMLQRRLRVGYNRAARMIEQMERDGVVSPTDSMGRRQVLAARYE